MPNPRFSRKVYNTDQAALDAIRDTEDYAPQKTAFSTERLNSLAAALESLLQDERRAMNKLDAVRDAKAQAAAELHEAILGAKQQVLAQYGSDSNEVQAIGLKKKSEYRRPPRRATTGE